MDRIGLAIAGAFVLLELATPFVGAVGYRRPGDAGSALRMAMLWLPMVFLTMLAPARHSLLFEAKLERVLAVTLWLNFGYAILQIASTLGVVPRALLVTSWLEPWAVDRNYNLIEGLRPSGFFANSTALSVFGIVGLCFFYARYVYHTQRRDFVNSLLSIGVIILSTSRTAYAAGAAPDRFGLSQLLPAGTLALHRGARRAARRALVAGTARFLRPRVEAPRPDGAVPSDLPVGGDGRLQSAALSAHDRLRRVRALAPGFRAAEPVDGHSPGRDRCRSPLVGARVARREEPRRQRPGPPFEPAQDRSLDQPCGPWQDEPSAERHRKPLPPEQRGPGFGVQRIAVEPAARQRVRGQSEAREERAQGPLVIVLQRLVADDGGSAARDDFFVDGGED
jgi:hypothetical protein